MIQRIDPRALDYEEMREIEQKGLDITKASMLWLMLESGPVLTTNTPDHRLWAERKNTKCCPAFTDGDIIRMLPKWIPGKEGRRAVLRIRMSPRWHFITGEYWCSQWETYCGFRAADLQDLLYRMFRWFTDNNKSDLLKPL